jgi:hypothetical protein
MKPWNERSKVSLRKEMRPIQTDQINIVGWLPRIQVSHPKETQLKNTPNPPQAG